jgi:hypothetical protein
MSMPTLDAFHRPDKGGFMSKSRAVTFQRSARGLFHASVMLGVGRELALA